MAGEPRPREQRLVNPEHASALLRRIVACWDANDDEGCMAAIAEARQLLITPNVERTA